MRAPGFGDLETVGGGPQARSHRRQIRFIGRHRKASREKGQRNEEQRLRGVKGGLSQWLVEGEEGSQCVSLQLGRRRV